MSSSKQEVSVPPRDRLSANLQAEFDRIGLPTAELARRLDVTEKTLASWRAGKTVPNFGSVVKIAPVFDREPEWFYLDHEAAA